MSDEQFDEDMIDEPAQQGVGEALAGPGDEAELVKALAAAREEAAQYRDSALRAQAELANARKRFEKQQAQAYSNANARAGAQITPYSGRF